MSEDRKRRLIQLPGIRLRQSAKPGKEHVKVVMQFGRTIGFVEDVRRRSEDEKGYRSMRPYLAKAEHGAFISYCDSLNEAIRRVYDNHNE